MKIKESNKHSFYLQAVNKFKQAKYLFILAIILIYSVFLILLGGVVHKEGVFGEVIIPAIQQNVKIPLNYLYGVLSEPEKLIIDIKHKDYQKLSFKRKNAMNEGVLHPFPEDYVNAKIRWDGKTTKAKLRLKGDLSDHWARDYKWSFRVKTKGDSTILGMKNFSLQHPRTRGFFNDWILHKILKREGLITLRYDFVDVIVNGKQLGIYALEEHFEQKLLENNQRIDGPIIRIKDHLLWYLVDPKTGFTRDKIDELYTVSPIDAFTSSTINRDKRLLSNFNTAKNLLESFRRGKLKTSEVFDADKLAKLFAVIDLFGYHHTTAYSNIRFYYNPITSRLEPIGYDNTFIKEAMFIEGQGKRIATSNMVNKERLNWKETFFEDKIFFEKYIKAVSEVSERKYLDELFTDVGDEFMEKLKIVYKSFPAYSFDAEKNILYKNQEEISRILNPLEGIQAYVKKYDRNNNELILEIGNNQLLPVQVRSVTINGSIYEIANKAESLLQAKTKYKPMNFTDIKISTEENILWLDSANNNIKVEYSLLGRSDIKEVAVFPWSHLDAGFLENDVIRSRPNVEEFGFIRISESEKKIYIQPGSWIIDKNLILPEGYLVSCGPNTELDIVNASFILSYSPLEISGEESNPVVFKSSDRTGQGVLVLTADKKSVLNNVAFKNLSSPRQSGLEIDGALTFYESEVDMSGASFQENKSDFDLHIIRSDFNIKKSVFNYSNKVAINAMFSNGSISDSIFINGNNTAIELTGSTVGAENVEISDTRVNGLKIKDRSRLNINNVLISSVLNAFISQNSSVITVNQPKIENCGNAFAALQTKTDYGPSTISVAEFDDSYIDGSYLIEDKSILIINDKKYEPSTKDVFDKLRKI